MCVCVCVCVCVCYVNCTYLQYKADENTTEIFSLNTELKLPESLDEWHAFNVTDSSTQLQ